MNIDIKGKVICLSGSNKFKEEFQKILSEFTEGGAIVLAPTIFDHTDVENLDEEQQEMLFQNHLKKIRMSDIVYIIDKDSYVGNNTIKEIKYAEDLEIPVIYMENHNNNRESYPENPYSKEKSWKWFQDTGLVLQVNQILHIFGIAITIKRDDSGNLVKVFPSRVKFRGFGEDSIDKSYTKVSKYLKENSEEILKDITDPYEDITIEITDETKMLSDIAISDDPIINQEIIDTIIPSGVRNILEKTNAQALVEILSKISEGKFNKIKNEPKYVTVEEIEITD